MRTKAECRGKVGPSRELGIGGWGEKKRQAERSVERDEGIRKAVNDGVGGETDHRQYSEENHVATERKAGGRVGDSSPHTLSSCVLLTGGLPLRAWEHCPGLEMTVSKPLS